jgi:hypothetical protein
MCFPLFRASILEFSLKETSYPEICGRSYPAMIPVFPYGFAYCWVFSFSTFAASSSRILFSIFARSSAVLFLRSLVRENAVNLQTYLSNPIGYPPLRGG